MGHGRGRSHIQQVATAALQVRQCGAIGVHHPHQVDLDDPLPAAYLLQAQGAGSGDARVGHHHVESAQRLGRFIDCAGDLVAIGHVAFGHERALAAALGHRGQLVRLQSQQGQARALSGQALGQRSTDAARGPGDQHPAAGQ